MMRRDWGWGKLAWGTVAWSRPTSSGTKGLLSLAVMVAGLGCTQCGGEWKTSSDGAAGSGSADAAPRCDGAPASFFFDESRALRIELEVLPSDWEEVLDDEDDGTLVEDNPPYVPADLTVGGERLTQVALRRKGDTRGDEGLDLKLSFDRYVEGQTLCGFTKLNLHSDAWIPQHLGYGLFRDAGIPAPHTGWATVSVNGEQLGPYLLVEQVDRHFLCDRFGEPCDGALYKPGGFAASLQYLGPTIESYPGLSPKLETLDHSAFLQFTETMTMGAIDQVAQVIDIEPTLLYLAADRYTRSWPRYSEHDYYLYEAMPGQFVFIPWDMDDAFVEPVWTPLCTAHADGLPPAAGEHYEVVSERLLSQPDRFNRFVDHLTALVEGSEVREARMARLETARAVASGEGELTVSASTFLDVEMQATGWLEKVADDPDPETEIALAAASPCGQPFPACDQAGALRCAEDRIETCARHADQRLGWTLESDCGLQGGTCEEPGQCVAPP